MAKYQISVLKKRETEPSNPGGSNLKDTVMLTLKWFDYQNFELKSGDAKKKIVLQELRTLPKHSIRFNKPIEKKETLKVTRQGNHQNVLWEDKVKIPPHLVDKEKGGLLG